MVENLPPFRNQRSSKGAGKNLIPIAIVIAVLIVVGATLIYIKGAERPAEVLERDEPVVPVQPEAPSVEEEPPFDLLVLENFAKCLTQKGVKFYGTYWCGWCTRQKEIFGQAAQYLPYIECAPDRATQDELAMCKEANVSSIPDWRFPDGRQELGMQPLEKLAELSGCQLK